MHSGFLGLVPKLQLGDPLRNANGSVANRRENTMLTRRFSSRAGLLLAASMIAAVSSTSGQTIPVEAQVIAARPALPEHVKLARDANGGNPQP